MKPQKQDKPTTANPYHKIVALPVPTYTNTTTVLSLAGVNMNLAESAKAAFAARLNLGLAGGKGMGKSQLLDDIQSWFGYNASYVLGRNDLDIKTLYRMLNFKGLKEAQETGGMISMQDISAVTANISRPLIVVEEINRCLEMVQNQLFNVYEGFVEIDGTRYNLGQATPLMVTNLKGEEKEKLVKYSIGLWSANIGNGDYTGTSSMDAALKERSHIIIDVDNFRAGREHPEDLDNILRASAGEVRLKQQETRDDHTQDFFDAFKYLVQKAAKPTTEELIYETMLFRYLQLGLDHIPVETADNSKTIMKNVWPAYAEEKKIGPDGSDEQILYRMVAPASTRAALTILAFARSLREYVQAKDGQAEPTVIDSVIEAFRLVAPYTGIITNPNRIREDYFGNEYRAGCAAADAIKRRIDGADDLIKAIVHCKFEGKPLPQKITDELHGDYACFR